MTRNPFRKTDVPKFVHDYHFYGVYDQISNNCHKLKFKLSMFHFMICDDISDAISPNKLFHMLLKNLSLLAYERKLQDFSLSDQKKFVSPYMHYAFVGSSSTKPKTRVVWMIRGLLRWVLFTCPRFNSFNYLWTCFFSVFSYFIFLGCFVYSKKI